VEALRADLQTVLGRSIQVREMRLREIEPGVVEAVAVVRADRGFDLRFRATGETVIEAYGRHVTDGHPERIPRGERAVPEN
jgi:hypothetical protein